MTPQQKSKDLINSFYYALPNNGSEMGLNSTTERYKEGIQCALICVDEVMNSIPSLDECKSLYVFWSNVKHELNKQD